MSKDKTPEYAEIKKLVASLSNESLEFMYLWCWVELCERGLGQLVPYEEE